MLSSEFKLPFDDFKNLETQIQFFAPLNVVSSPFNDAYLRWPNDGLGEAYGFIFKLSSDNKPFILKTFVNLVDLPAEECIEWLIDAENVDVAKRVFAGLQLVGISIAWEKAKN